MLPATVETRLAALGCTKINLQIVQHNDNVTQFYQGHGYTVEQRISMGKTLNTNP